MGETIKSNDVLAIDLVRVWGKVVSRAWLIILIATLCAIFAFGGTWLFITHQYEASAVFYVNNNSLSVGDASLSLSSGDISAAKDLVDSYLIILDSWPTRDQIIEHAQVNRTRGELAGMMDAQSINDTEIFKVTITSPDPNEAEAIANSVAYVLPIRISEIIEGTSARVVETALVPAVPSSPSHPRNTVLDFLCGFILTLGMIVLREVFDNTVRAGELLQPQPSERGNAQAGVRCAQVLGIAYNCTNKEGGRYGKGYYKRYYKRHGSGYYKSDRSPYAPEEMPVDISDVEV